MQNMPSRPAAVRLPPSRKHPVPDDRHRIPDPYRAQYRHYRIPDPQRRREPVSFADAQRLHNPLPDPPRSPTLPHFHDIESQVDHTSVVDPRHAPDSRRERPNRGAAHRVWSLDPDAIRPHRVQPPREFPQPSPLLEPYGPDTPIPVRVPPVSPLNPSQSWPIFEVVVWRGVDAENVYIEPDWDDERLLRAISKVYDKLRTWRRYLSLRTFSHFEPAVNRSTAIDRAPWTAAGPGIIPSGRVINAPEQFDPSGPTGPTPVTELPKMFPVTVNYQGVFQPTHRSEIMRIRHHFKHPQRASGLFYFIRQVTRDSSQGIRIIERWDPVRISALVVTPVLCTFVFAVAWAKLKSVSDAFTIAGYLTSAAATCLIFISIMNWVYGSRE